MPTGITHDQYSMDCLQIGLYDTQSKHPSIKYVHISGSSPGPTTAVDLEEALPLQHLLAPVGLCKECIATAVDSLEADAAAGRAPAEVDSDLGSRSFGAALQAVLRYSTYTCICLDVHDSRHCQLTLWCISWTAWHQHLGGENNVLVSLPPTPLQHQHASCLSAWDLAQACHTVLSDAGR